MSGELKRGRPPYRDQLTPAEWRVVQSAQHGLSNPEIAKRLGISVNAVKFHIANAIEKTGVRNKRALVKWIGIPNDSLANSKTNKHGQPMDNKSLTIGQIARSVKSIEKSEHWYRESLGLPHLFTFGTLAFFDLGKVRFMLSQSDDINANESIIYFRCTDIKTEYARLEQRGVNVSHAPHKIHQHEDGSEEWMAFFNDLENRPLGLMCTYTKHE